MTVAGGYEGQNPAVKILTVMSIDPSRSLALADFKSKMHKKPNRF
jgi:hypothetical protein